MVAQLRVASLAAAGLAGFPRAWRFVAASATAVLSFAGCSLLTDLSGLSGAEPADTDAGEAGRGADARTDAPSSPFDAAAIPDGGSAYVDAVLADKPIAYYPLEESSGTIARDVVGGKHATWGGKVVLGEPGVVGAGARLDGESTRLEMPTGSFGFEGRHPYTIEVWVKPAIVDGYVRFVFDQGMRGGPAGGYQMYFTDTFFLCSRSDDDGGADGYGSITPVPSGELVHLAMTYDGTNVNLFANGVTKGAANASLALPGGADRLLVFGDNAQGQTFKLAGVIDEIAIYDTALPADRLLAHYAARPK